MIGAISEAKGKPKVAPVTTTPKPDAKPQPKDEHADVAHAS
jgi:hypothetical protein